MTVGVDGHLQVPEQPRRVLHFVDDDRRRMRREKTLRVGFGLLGHAGQVQTDQPVFGEQHAQQSGFADLAGSGDHHGRVFSG